MSKSSFVGRIGVAAYFWAVCFALSDRVQAQCPCNSDIVPPFGGFNQPDLNDVSAVINCWRGTTGNIGAPCDINCDGVITTLDMGIAICGFRTLNNPQCCGPSGACCQSTFPQCHEYPVFGGGESGCQGTWLGQGSDCTPNLCDCNQNGMSDECDISCGDPGSICDVPGCGLAADCNENTIPDSCESPDPATRGACCFSNQGVPACTSGTTLASCDNVSGTWFACKRCATQSLGIVTEPGGDIFVHVIGPPVDCIVLPFAGQREASGVCQPGEPLTDAWVSPANAQMCHTFGTSGSPAIPSDFFGPGSDPFTGQVCLKGESLNDPDFPTADTLISRSADPFDRCDAPSQTPSIVDIEIVALSLVSVSPITVTFNGGQNPQQWDAQVNLSTVPSPVGSLTAVKTYCNGGTYTSALPVRPRFTFSPVGGGTPAVLDTGLAGHDPIQLIQSDPQPWVSEVQEMLPLVSDMCSYFHPGVSDMLEGLPCDCNGNGTVDSCEIEQQTSNDCNLNQAPDACDIASGASQDVDQNGIPDECPQIVIPATPVPDPSGLDKTRFISFSIAGGDGETALRVVLESLHHVVPPYSGGPSIPFTSFEGQVRWVGPPAQYVESSASGVPFYAARLQCAPHYQDWSTVGLMHVTGSAVTPSSQYGIENFGASCQGSEANCAAVSAPLAILTTRWGDVRSPYNPPDPSVQPDISDVSALVDKFRGAQGAPIKARGILAGEPGNSFGEITPIVLAVDFGFSHISACVDAFRGVPYPYTIAACP